MAEKKFLDFMDRFDGGGMGKSGDKFEGGGLLSLLGNIFATPRGSEDRAKKEALAGLLGNTRPNMRPNRPAPADPAASLRPQARPQIKTNLDPFGGEGPNITGVAAERGMGLDPFGGAGDFIPPQSQVDQEMAMGLGPFGYGGRPIYENVPETSGMNPSNAYPDPRQRFAGQLVEMIGPEAAENLMRSGMGEQAYEAFVANKYNMPNY